MPFTIPIYDSIKDEWTNTGGEKIAWRATANALKESIKDMYSGEIIIIGDSVIKPYDAVMISDTYEDIAGIVEVETVTHTFSTETGFTTGIVPDCISNIDNSYTQRMTSTLRSSLGPVITALSAVSVSNIAFRNITKPMMLRVASLVKNGSDTAINAVRAIGGFIGQEQVASFGSLMDADARAILANSVGLTGLDFEIYDSINKLKKASLIGDLKITISSGGDVNHAFRVFNSLDEKIDIKSGEKLKLDIEEAIKTANGDNKKKLKEASSIVDDLLVSQKEALKVLEDFKLSGDDISDFADEMIKAIDALEDSVDKKSLKKSAEYLKKLKGKSISYGDEFAEVIEEMGKLTRHVDEVATSKPLMKIIKDIDSAASKISTNLNNLKHVDIDLKDINMIRKGKNLKGILMASNIVAILAQLAISKSAQEFLERKLRDWQTLTIFPVFKNGNAWTAGLNGSKGLVVGSPTWNERGFMDELAEWALEDSFFAPIVDFMIGTSDAKEILNKYKKDNGFIGSDTADQQAKINGLLEAVSKTEYDKIQPFLELFTDLRVVAGSKDMKVAGAINSINGVNDIEAYNLSDSDIHYIFDDVTLSDAKRNGYLEMNYGKDSKKVRLLDNVRKTEGNHVLSKVTSENNSTVWDIPYLRKDSITLLREIVTRYEKIIQPDFGKPECNYEKLKENKIYINNATCINKKGWLSTGYRFTIQVNSSKELGNILNELKTEQEKILKQTDTTSSVFSYVKDSKYSNGYDIVIFPRKDV